MRKFSGFQIVREALRGNSGWEKQWDNPEPRAQYDVIIVGAGGHGLATAYYLAKEHGITNVAVLEKGWLGGGNTGRNTTIIRSNYLYDESAGIYDHAVKLWEGLSQELNYNVMYSPRGVMMLAHNVHDVQVLQAPRPRQPAQRRRQRMADAGRGEGFLPAAQHFAGMRAIRWWARRCSGAAARPAMTRSPGAMRAAHRRAASTSSRIARSPASAAGRTARSPASRPRAGFIGAKKIGVVAAGHTSVLMEMAGVRMPLESYPAAGAGLRAGQAVLPLRRHVQHGACLHLAVRQGRTGHRRGHRPVHVLFADRRAAHHQPHARRDLRDVPDVRAHEDAALLGRHRRCDAGPLADPGQDAGARAFTSIAAGAPAASRRRRVPAMSSPTPSRATSRTRSTPASRWNASAPAA